MAYLTSYKIQSPRDNMCFIIQKTRHDTYSDQDLSYPPHTAIYLANTISSCNQ